MPALRRAFALEQVHRVAVRVGEHLDLHMPRALDQALDIQGAVAERRARFTPRGGQRRRRRSPASRTAFMPMPPPPAAGLISDGEADAFAAARRMHRLTDRRVSSPGTTGTPALAMSRLAPVFEPIFSSADAGGPTKISPASSHARAKGARSERNP